MIYDAAYCFSKEEADGLDDDIAVAGVAHSPF